MYDFLIVLKRMKDLYTEPFDGGLLPFLPYSLWTFYPSFVVPHIHKQDLSVRSCCMWVLFGNISYGFFCKNGTIWGVKKHLPMRCPDPLQSGPFFCNFTWYCIGVGDKENSLLRASILSLLSGQASSKARTGKVHL